MNLRTALYAALLVSANTAFGDPTALEALKAGDMKKLALHSEPQEVPTDTVFTDADGGALRLADYAGKVAVVNFWATWCPPCRKEMPSLDALEATLGGEDFVVLPIATLRTKQAGAVKFFTDIDVQHLPILMDTNGDLARAMGVRGLPVTVILDREGREIGRLTGEADWASDETLALLRAVIGAPEG